MRQLIKGSALTQSGGQIRIKFAGGGSNYVIRNVVIGKREGTYDMETATKVCFDGKTGDSCIGHDNDVTIPSNSGKFSDWIDFRLDAGSDYIVSWFQVCYPDYYVEWTTSGGAASETMLWYYIYYTGDGGGPNRKSTNDGKALEAKLSSSLSIPDGSPGGGGTGPHTKSALTNIESIEVHPWKSSSLERDSKGLVEEINELENNQMF